MNFQYESTLAGVNQKRRWRAACTLLSGNPRPGEALSTRSIVIQEAALIAINTTFFTSVF